MLKRCRDAHEKWKPVDSLLTLFAAVLVAIVGAHWFLLIPRIEEAKREAVSAAKAAVISADVVREISKKVRPYAVLNVAAQNESAVFTHDAGASDVLESASIWGTKTNAQSILTLKMKKFVSVPPLVRSLTATVYVHQSWRTNKFDWAYDIRPAPTTVTFEGVNTTEIQQPSEETHYSFLVELLTN